MCLIQAKRLIGVKCFTALVLLAWLQLGHANTHVEKALVYIDPVYYQHHERLLHPYYDYWFSQGPTFETIAVNALQAKVDGIRLCEAGQVAQQVIALSPTIFYNPQIRRFYSSIKADVYASDGTLIGEYKGEGEQAGFQSVDVGLEGHMQAAYQTAMTNLMQTIDLGQDKPVNSQVQLPCQIIGAQTKPRYIR